MAAIALEKEAHRPFAASTDRQAAPRLQDVLPAGVLRRLAAKEHLFLEGDKKIAIFHVVSGAIALYRMLEDGRRQVLHFAQPGDLVSLSWAATETYSAQATDHAVVKSIPVSALRRAVESNPQFGVLVCEALVAELECVRRHLVSIGQDGANARVASFLVSLCERAEAAGQDGDSFHLPMTRSDIGDYLGLTLESVSRAFSHFKRLRIITIERAVNIRVLNRTQLDWTASGDEDMGLASDAWGRCAGTAMAV